MGDEILITFNKKTGKPSIDVLEGGGGERCLDLTQPLEEAMGMLNPEREEKPEMLMPQQSERETQTW